MAKNKKTELDFFLAGHKPAYWEEDISEETKAYLKQNYPYCRGISPSQGTVITQRFKHVTLPDGTKEVIEEELAPQCPLGDTMYFQNEELKKTYQKTVALLDNPLDRMYLAGVTLGYPPSACQFFTYDRYMTTPLNTKISLGGMSFMTDRSLLIDNVKWLHENYHLPEEEWKITIENRQGKRKAISVHGRDICYEEMEEVFTAICLGKKPIIQQKRA